MIADVKIYNVLISCASDIVEELNIIDGVIKYYNQTTGYNNCIQLSPRHWKEDSYPEYGSDPQGLLYKQFINECDFAIAIFWTKFGHPTSNYQSGVQDEIEYFHSNNKDVLLFFSDCPICPSLIDIKQLKNLRNYKKKIREERKGLNYTYGNLDDFKEKLRLVIYKFMEDKYNIR